MTITGLCCRWPVWMVTSASLSGLLAFKDSLLEHLAFCLQFWHLKLFSLFTLTPGSDGLQVPWEVCVPWPGSTGRPITRGPQKAGRMASASHLQVLLQVPCHSPCRWWVALRRVFLDSFELFLSTPGIIPWSLPFSSSSAPICTLLRPPSPIVLGYRRKTESSLFPCILSPSIKPPWKKWYLGLWILPDNCLSSTKPRGQETEISEAEIRECATLCINFYHLAFSHLILDVVKKTFFKDLLLSLSLLFRACFKL